MAAPTPTARTTPGGLALEDGYRTVVTIAQDVDISIWEVSVTPPSVEGGDGIDQTTMHNNRWRVALPKNLETLGDCTFNGAYDPDLYNQAISAINVNTTITITFPDGSTLAFYGFLKTFAPDAVVEGTQPRATFTIQASNWDPANDVEAGPVLTSVSGT